VVVPTTSIDASRTLSLPDLAANGVSDTIYYGYRAWGPNWIFDPSWTEGSQQGFVTDVDADGNHFNPNKLLLDPYAQVTGRSNEGNQGNGQGIP
jgi:isoamylase